MLPATHHNPPRWHIEPVRVLRIVGAEDPQEVLRGLARHRTIWDHVVTFLALDAVANLRGANRLLHIVLHFILATMTARARVRYQALSMMAFGEVVRQRRIAVNRARGRS